MAVDISMALCASVPPWFALVFSVLSGSRQRYACTRAGVCSGPNFRESALRYESSVL